MKGYEIHVVLELLGLVQYFLAEDDFFFYMSSDLFTWQMKLRLAIYGPTFNYYQKLSYLLSILPFQTKKIK